MIAFKRFFHVAIVESNVKKQGIKLHKMVNPERKRKKSNFNIMPSMKSLSKVNFEPGKQALRRVAVLNKLFMKHITDLMSTGSVSLETLGRGIEISKVKITQDFQILNVYWVCKGDESDIKTEALFNRVAGTLRNEMSTLRLMSQVPHITFVKDIQAARLFDLDCRLTNADYGEDYTPTELGQLLKSEFTTNSKLSPDMMAKIKQLEESLPIDDAPIPEMTHTVYGLDHAKIMGQLKAARKKNQDAWGGIRDDLSTISYRVSNEKVEVVDHDKQKEDLAEFLRRRQIHQKKIQREMRSSAQKMNLLSDEYSQSDRDDETFEHDDYFEEDEYENEDIYDKYSMNFSSEHEPKDTLD